MGKTQLPPHIRNSERKDFKRCQQRWWWNWRQGLTPKSQKPDALWFGTGIHLALQERYKYNGLKRGTRVLGTWRDYVADEVATVRTSISPGGVTGFSPEEQWVDAGDLGEAMLGAYLDEYGDDPRWHVISAEQTFEIPIPRLDRSGTLCLLNGTFDLVARDLAADDALWLWDHKTAKTIQTSHLSLDDQAGTYFAVASDVLAAQGLVKPGDRLEGILYNFLRKSKPDERPKDAEGFYLNKNGTRSARQPTPNFLREHVTRTATERRTQIRRIQYDAMQMEAIRKHALPMTKNPTKDCAWDCAFFQMCELHEAGDDWREFRDLAFTKRDPYADHRSDLTGAE